RGGVRGGGGVGIRVEEGRGQDGHAHVGALGRQDCRHEQLQRILMGQGAVGVRVLSLQNARDLSGAFLTQRIGFLTDRRPWACVILTCVLTCTTYSGSCHSLTVLSVLPERTKRPSGLGARQVTPALWPLRQAISQPESTSQRRSVRSWLPESMRRPPAVKAHAVTICLWP